VDEIRWPAGWQQEAIDALLPYRGTDDRVDIDFGTEDGEFVASLGGHVYVEDGEPTIIWDRSGRPDVYPWKLLTGPVVKIELVVPRHRPRLLFEAESG
jgi:hypothetical protein